MALDYTNTSPREPLFFFFFIIFVDLNFLSRRRRCPPSTPVLLSQHPPLLPGHRAVRPVHHDHVQGVLPLQETENRGGAGAAGRPEQKHILHPLPEEPVPTEQRRPPGGAAPQPGGPHASTVQLCLLRAPAGLQ